MNIEIFVRVGDRRVTLGGGIQWENYAEERHLITYEYDEDEAVKESIASLKKMLKRAKAQIAEARK